MFKRIWTVHQDSSSEWACWTSMCPSRIKALWIIWMPQRGARLALSWKGSASRALGPQKTLSRVHSQSKETQRASQRSAREYVTCAGQEVEVKSLSCVWLYATPWTVAYKTPLSMEFSRQEYWSGLPFPSPRDLSNPGIEPGSPALQADALPSEPPGKSLIRIYTHTYSFSDSFPLLS